MKTFDFSSPQFKHDPQPVLEAMGESGALVSSKIPTLGRCFVTANHAATTDLLKGVDQFAMEPKNAGKKSYTWWWNLAPEPLRRMSKNILQSDEPDHRRLRGLVDNAFHRQNLNNLQERIEKLSDSYLDQLDSQSNEPRDFIELVARRLPITVICEMLGIPENDRAWLTDFFVTMVKKSNNLLSILMFMPRFKPLFRYFEDLFDEIRDNPRPGLISALVQAKEEGDGLDDDELLTMVFVLFLAGHETTVHLLSGSLWALSRFPKERARLQANPSLMDTGVDELLRYVSPVMMTKPRFAKEEMTFHGVDLKQADLLVGFLISANYDPSVFANPAQLDLSRKPNRHTSWGDGIHFCLGAQLAKMETRILLTKLFDRYPDIQLAVAPNKVAWNKGPFLRSMSELPVVTNC